MRRLFLFPRFFSLWLILSLALPTSPSFALRSMGADAQAVRGGLEETLKLGSTQNTPAQRVAAGAEEGEIPAENPAGNVKDPYRSLKEAIGNLGTIEERQARQDLLDKKTDLARKIRAVKRLARFTRVTAISALQEAFQQYGDPEFASLRVRIVQAVYGIARRIVSVEAPQTDFLSLPEIEQATQLLNLASADKDGVVQDVATEAMVSLKKAQGKQVLSRPPALQPPENAAGAEEEKRFGITTVRVGAQSELSYYKNISKILRAIVDSLETFGVSLGKEIYPIIITGIEGHLIHNLFGHVDKEHRPSARISFAFAEVPNPQGGFQLDFLIEYRDENPKPWEVDVMKSVKAGVSRNEGGGGLTAILSEVTKTKGTLIIDAVDATGRHRLQFVKQTQKPKQLLVDPNKKGVEIIARIPLGAVTESVSEKLVMQSLDAMDSESSAAGAEEKWSGRINPQQALMLAKLMGKVVKKAEQRRKNVTLDLFQTVIQEAGQYPTNLALIQLSLDQVWYFFDRLPGILGVPWGGGSDLSLQAVLAIALINRIHDRWEAGTFPLLESRESQVDTLFSDNLSLENQPGTRRTISDVDAAISPEEQRGIAARLLDALLEPPLPAAGAEETGVEPSGRDVLGSGAGFAGLKSQSVPLQEQSRSQTTPVTVGLPLSFSDSLLAEDQGSSNTQRKEKPANSEGERVKTHSAEYGANNQRGPGDSRHIRQDRSAPIPLLVRQPEHPIKSTMLPVASQSAAGAEEKGLAVRRYEGLFLNGNAGGLEENPAVAVHLNVEEGHRETWQVDVPSAELDRVGRIFRQDGAELPSALGDEVRVIDFSARLLEAEGVFIQEQAGAGDLAFVGPGANNLEGLDDLLRAYRMKGIQLTPKALGELAEMDRARRAAALRALSSVPVTGLVEMVGVSVEQGANDFKVYWYV